MSLRHRWLIASGALFLCWANGPETIAQEDIQGPNLIASENRPQETHSLTRTGARKTMVVAAVERVKAAVVNIHSERNGSPVSGDSFPAAAPSRVNGMGTGIVIDPRGYIVTNQHVVDDVTALRIRLNDGTSTSAVVVARHAELDLAIIKINPPYPLAIMPIGTASDLMVGETVIAIGNAYGYEHTVSVGVVSAIKRDVNLNKDMSYKSLIQTDASINPGNSGGPLVNINGELVGVNVAIRAGAQGIGFAIPVDHMVRSVSDMMMKIRRRETSYDGFASRDVLVANNDGVTRKVVVDHVDPASPAEAAGLKAGDVLKQVGDVKIDSGIDVERGLIDLKSGSSVTFVVRRADQEQRLQIALVSGIVWQRLGLGLSPVNGEMVSRANNQLHGGLEVTAVNPNGMGAKAGIRKGDILVGLHKFETVKMDNVTYILNQPDANAGNSIPFFIVRSGQMRSGQLPMLP